MGQVFEILADAGIIDTELAMRKKKAVDFRNLTVQHYDAINWAVVHAIATQRLDDFKLFAKGVADFDF